MEKKRRGLGSAKGRLGRVCHEWQTAQASVSRTSVQVSFRGTEAEASRRGAGEGDCGMGRGSRPIGKGGQGVRHPPSDDSHGDVCHQKPRPPQKKISRARKYFDMFWPFFGVIYGKAFRHMLGLDSCRGWTYRCHSIGGLSRPENGQGRA